MATIDIDPEFKEFAGVLRPEERAQLEANLLRDGRALDPLIAWRTGGKLILVDGHHRLELCRQHGLPYDVRELEFDSRDDVLIWIASHQVGRRNWTESAFAYHLGKLYDARKRQGARTDLTSPHSEERLTTAQRIADERGVSKATVERAATYSRAIERIAEVAGPEAKASILDERITVTREDVIELAGRPDAIREVFGDSTPSGGRLRHVLRDARRLDKYGRLQELGTPGPGADWGRFAVILADPPWKYENEPTWGGAEDTFATMELEGLVALRQSLDLDAHLTTDCVLFLWVTQPIWPQALALIEGWGFEFKTGMVWCKSRMGLGNYVRINHEHLLIATRGNLTPLESSRPLSVFEGEPWRPGLHSAKPDTTYEIIERMYPNVPKLELFARQRRPGWVSWGNELPAAERVIEPQLCGET